MKICIDFDDTLHDTKDRRAGHRMGQPEPGAVAAMRYMYAMHHELIILTGRKVDNPKVYEVVKNWLDHFQIPYHEITNIKPDGYDLIIDNKAIHYDNWRTALVWVSRFAADPKALQSFSDESDAEFDKRPH